MNSITGTLQQFAIPVLVGALSYTLIPANNLTTKVVASIAKMLFTYVICKIFQNTQHTSNSTQITQHIDTCDSGIERLRGEYLLEGIEGEANLNTLLKNPQYARELADGFVFLNRADPELLKGDRGQANRDMLVQNRKYIRSLVSGIERLGGRDLLKGTEGQANLDILFQNARYARELADGLGSMKSAGLLNGNQRQANLNRLILNAPNADKIASELDKHSQKTFDDIVDEIEKSLALRAAKTLLRSNSALSDSKIKKLPLDLVRNSISYLMPPRLDNPSFTSELHDINNKNIDPTQYENKKKCNESNKT